MTMSDKNIEPNLENIRNLLSPYLDGEVSNEEQMLVEQAIATSTELRRELEQLQQTVTLLNALPSVPAPRPFTLSEADVQPVAARPRKSLWLSSWVRGVAILATTILCVMIAVGAFLLNNTNSEMQLARAPNADMAAGADSQAAEAEAEIAVGEAAEEALEEQAAESAAEAPAPAPPAASEMSQEPIIIDGSESAEAPVDEEITTADTETESGSAGEAAVDDLAPAEGETTLAESQDRDEEDAVENSTTDASQPAIVTSSPIPAQAPPAPTQTPASAPTSIPEVAAPAEEPLPETEESAMAQSAPAAAEAPEDTAAKVGGEDQNLNKEETLTYEDETARQQVTATASSLAETQVTATTTPTSIPAPSPTPLPSVTPTDRAEAATLQPEPPPAPAELLLEEQTGISPGFVRVSLLIVTIIILIAGIIIWLKLGKKA